MINHSTKQFAFWCRVKNYRIQNHTHCMKKSFHGILQNMLQLAPLRFFSHLTRNCKRVMWFICCPDIKDCLVGIPFINQTNYLLHSDYTGACQTCQRECASIGSFNIFRSSLGKVKCLIVILFFPIWVKFIYNYIDG